MADAFMAARENQEESSVDAGVSISALLLTIGETTFPEAYQALQRQSIPFHQVIVIRDVSPFSTAFNQGVLQIDTPFFIQCDADMILDRNCAEVLISRIKPETGMVVGDLRDPLQGQTRGVKLYRTQCCRLYPLEDSSNCDRIFLLQLLKNHWAVELLEKHLTLGTHTSELSDSVYQFERFKFKGVKIYARKAWPELESRLIRLARSEHQEVASMAVAAMICGFHITHKEDHLRGFTPSPEYGLWQERFSQWGELDAKRGVYPFLKVYNYFVGYWNGALVRLTKKKLRLDTIAKECLNSDQIALWAYLLGLCASVMNSSETIKQNFITRFVRMFPFLHYLKKKLKTSSRGRTDATTKARRHEEKIDCDPS